MKLDSLPAGNGPSCPSFPFSRIPSYNGDCVPFQNGSRSPDEIPANSGQGCGKPRFQVQNYRPLHERMQKMIESGDKFFSLEFFPPRTPNGVTNLLARLERMGEGGPLFVDITWHSAGSPVRTRKLCVEAVAKVHSDVARGNSQEE